jgi:hypothetical protein
MSIRTIKLPYYSLEKDEILNYIKNYNNVLRFTYNRVCENEKISTKNLTLLQKKMNNIFVDSHFLNSAQFEAKQLSENKNIIFGSKKLYFERLNNKISKDNYKLAKLLPLASIGEACKKSNRKFSIIDEKTILFKPDRNNHFELKLPKLRKNLKRDLFKLLELQENCKIPITYKLDIENIYISFENNNIQQNDVFNKVQDRVFSIDMNPNYIGWSVVDWETSDNYKIIDSGVISIKNLNDYDNSLKGKGLDSSSKERNYVANKRKFEVVDSANFLIKKAIHYKCELFSIEKLNIKSSNKEKGKRFNKLCNNQWNRNILINQLRKKCDLSKIKLLEIEASYSSFQGNLVFREKRLPDMILSSVEIGRRGFEFYHQYIKKDKEIKKNIIFNDSQNTKVKVIQSLEELGCFESFDNLKNLYYKLKTLKLKYRVPLEGVVPKSVFSKKHIKSMTVLYSY